MEIFYYKAENKKGEIIEGKVEAENEKIVEDILLERGLKVVFIQRKRQFLRWQKRLVIFKHVPLRELVIFTRELAVLISSNIPLVRSLKVLAVQTLQPNLKIIVAEIADEIEGGSTLSKTLEKYPAVFNDFYINLIRSGEKTGKLDEVLEYLANQGEKDYDMLNRLRNMMIYPIFIFAGTVVVILITMIVILPRLTDMLTDAMTELPLSTRFLIGLSDFFVGFWWLILLILVCLGVILYFFYQTPQGKYTIDRIKLKIPVIGQLLQKIYVVRFATSLRTLMVGGIDVVSSLDVIGSVTGNSVYKKLIYNTKQSVQDGNPIATVFLQSRDIPYLVGHMLTVGEATGKIDMILEKMSNFYSREVDNTLSNLVTVIEPVFIIFLGLGVGVVVSAIILPLYNLSSQI